MSHDHGARSRPTTWVTTDPDVVLDAVALVRAHASDDDEAATSILDHCCGRCVANLAAYLLAAAAEHPEILDGGLDVLHRYALPQAGGG